MIQIILDTVKTLLSDDARRSASGLVEFIKRSPSWKKDICTLEAHVSRDAREHAYFLGELTIQKMQSLSYSGECIGSCEFVYRELTANAFEYGWRRAERSGYIKIVLEITRDFVSASIFNPKRRVFDLDAIIKKQETILKFDPHPKRGRGLVMSAEYADDLQRTPKGDGVKALFFRNRVELKTESHGEVAFVHVQGGLGNPSFVRRLENVVLRISDPQVVVNIPMLKGDLQHRKPPTSCITTSINLAEALAERNQTLYLARMPLSSPSSDFKRHIVPGDPALLMRKMKKDFPGNLIVFALAVLVLASSVQAQTDHPPTANIGSNTNEQHLLTAVPQLRWTKSYLVSTGWLKPGQVVQPKANMFIKKDYSLLGLRGEIQILFDQSVFKGESPCNVGFWIEGEEGFSALYRAIKKALAVPEQRSGDAKSGSRIEWEVKGQASEYHVALVRRVFGNDVERSLEIDIKDAGRHRALDR